MKKIIITFLFICFAASSIASEAQNKNTNISPQRQIYIKKAERINPVIFTRGRVTITQATQINSDADPVKIGMPVRIERGVEMFPGDFFIQDVIPEGEAILFLFNNGPNIQAIDVSKMLTKRDMVFINEKNRIVEIRRSVGKNDTALQTFRPSVAVLQMPDGDIKKYGMKLNDEVKLETSSEVIK